MNIILLGASKFGLKCLETLHGIEGCQITGVITAPRTFSISYRPEGVINIRYADFESWCTEHGYSCVVMKDGMNDESLFAQARKWEPDIFVVAGWYHMVPRKWRDLAPAYGLHASLLPDYSGGAPLVWAMINGEKQTGITLFQFDGGVDSGLILGQKATAISAEDTIATLYARIEQLGLDLLRENLPGLANGSVRLTPQDESKRRIFPQRSPEDGIIDWNQPARDLHNFIRAQTRPYPGAFTTWQGSKIHVWQAEITDDHANRGLALGQVLDNPERLLVRTGTGTLEIMEVQFEEQDITGAEFGKIIGGGVILGT